MRKILAAIGLCIMPIFLFAGDSSKPFLDVKEIVYHNTRTVYQPFTTDAILFETTGSTIGVFASSMTLVHSGTTYDYIFSVSTTNTAGEIVTLLNAISGITASMFQGAYPDNDSTQLATAASSYVTSSTFTFDNTLGMTYTLPADTNGRRNHLIDCMVNATFATGTTNVSIYDGASTSTQIRKEKVKTSVTDKPLNIPEKGYVYGSADTAMRIDVVGSTWITAGDMKITSFKE